MVNSTADIYPVVWDFNWKIHFYEEAEWKKQNYIPNAYASSRDSGELNDLLIDTQLN